MAVKNKVLYLCMIKNEKNKTMETKQVIKTGKFNLLNSGTGVYTRTNANDIKSISRILIKRAMREEGYEWRTSDVHRYIQSWVDYYNEIYDYDNVYDVTDTPHMIADHLVYCSSIHIIRASNNTEVNHEMRHDAYIEIVNFIEEHI